MNEDNLLEITEELSSVSNKWTRIGVQLKVDKVQLDNIKSQWSDPKDQLQEMISERLKQMPPLEWSDITKALESKTIGEKKLADEIEKKHVNPPEIQHSEG